MLGWCIARWMADRAPRIVLIENVPEWRDWGPTVVDGQDERGRPRRVQDPSRKGQHYRRWWRYCERLGYRMDSRVLDAADYGSASRRKRLFIIARRDGAPIVWPEDIRGGHQGEDRVSRDRSRRPGRGGPGAADAGRDRQRCAADVIDWSDLGSSIFERQRPLKPKTLARIAEGIRRFVLNNPRPFILRVTHGEGGGWHVAPADEPLRTQTTRQDLAVCSPILAPQNTDVFGQSPEHPGPTITTKGHQALVTPILATTGYGERAGQAARVGQVADLLGTCVNGVKQALVSPIVAVCAHGDGKDGTKRWGRPALPMDGPLNAIHAGGNNFAAVAPVMAYLNHGGKQSGGVDEPLRTVVAGGGHAMLVAALLTEYYSNGAGRRVDEPMGCATTHDRHGLVCVLIDGCEFVIVDILFRMLRPAELARAMGFPETYSWPRAQRDAVRLIGNAVQVDQAEALVRAVLPGGRRQREECAA